MNNNKDFTKLNDKQFLDIIKEELYKKLIDMKEIFNLPKYKIDNSIESLIFDLIPATNDGEIHDFISKSQDFNKLNYNFQKLQKTVVIKNHSNPRNVN